MKPFNPKKYREGSARQNFQKKVSGGFTLAETVVVVGITAVLMLGITLLFKNVFVDSRQETAALGAVDQGRSMSANFVNEIRNAANGSNGSFPLNQAGDSQIIFFTPYHAGGKINRIRYYISGTKLYKGVIVPVGTPAVYDPATETTSAILDNVQNGGGTPAFYYYNGNYNGSGSPLAQPVNVNTVGFVQLNLTILKQDAVGSTNTFSINDGAAIRNLKANLGN